jgi:hypothetical protein
MSFFAEYVEHAERESRRKRALVASIRAGHFEPKNKLTRDEAIMALLSEIAEHEHEVTLFRGRDYA